MRFFIRKFFNKIILYLTYFFAKFGVFVGNFLAIPVVPVMKTESKKFTVAEDTYTIEAMRQDVKALQASIAHFLGQNFAKSSNVKFI